MGSLATKLIALLNNSSEVLLSEKELDCLLEIVEHATSIDILQNIQLSKGVNFEAEIENHRSELRRIYLEHDFNSACKERGIEGILWLNCHIT